MATKENVAMDLNSAVILFQNREFEKAQSILKKLLKNKKPPAMAWFVSAIIHSQKRELVAAVSAFENAIQIQPNYPDAHNNLGVVLEMLNKTDSALKHYKTAMEQKNNYASAQFNYANLNHMLGDTETAEKFYLMALQSDPLYIKALNNLGLLYQQQNKLENSQKYFEKALKISPNDFEVLNNLAHTFYLKEQYPKALELYRKSLNLNNSAETLNNIGITLQAHGYYDQAEESFNQAIMMQPDYFEAYTNLANLFKATGKNILAEENYLKALKINPNSAPANNNYGLMLHQRGEYDLARQHFENALNANKSYKEARYNLGTYQLGTGDFCAAWRNYLYRPTPRHELAIDVQTISKQQLKNKKILLLKEQGIGDELFFLRFAKQLKIIASEVSYLASEKILPFTRQITCMDNVIDNEDAIKDYDYAISIGDLPALLVEDKNNIPASIKLSADVEKTKGFSQLLSQFGPPPYIGITWRGGQKVKNLLFKTIAIDPLAEALQSANATFVILQRHPSDNELAQLRNHKCFANIADLSHLNDDLPQMLSLLSMLDDYIGVSNTNMHLRMALGKTARVLVPHPPEWRWMLRGDQSPWFPSFQIYRQTADGNWKGALEFLSSQLLEKYGKQN